MPTSTNPSDSVASLYIWTLECLPAPLVGSSFLKPEACGPVRPNAHVPEGSPVYPLRWREMWVRLLKGFQHEGGGRIFCKSRTLTTLLTCLKVGFREKAPSQAPFTSLRFFWYPGDTESQATVKILNAAFLPCPELCSDVQLHLILCDPMDCSPPGSPVHGILQARIWSGLPVPPPGIFPPQELSPAPCTSCAGR